MKMVLAERNTESIRNGKRSRGPSPNGHESPDSSSEDENDAIPIPAEKIRVGRDYQAVCPELEPVEHRKPDQIADRALLVWSPTIDISDNKLDEYITVAKEKYGYNGEQALGMLFWHKHDLSRAALDLANFTPFPDEWTEEDKVLFDQAFQFHGKSFHRIRQMLPDKTIASLVKYYYSWKKIRARTSLMDRGTSGSAGNGKREGSSDGASDHDRDLDHDRDHASDKDSDNEEKKWRIHRGIRRGSGSPPPPSAAPAPPPAPLPPAPHTPHADHKQAVCGADDPPGKWCSVCGVRCSQTTQHNAHKMCQACLEHARRTGTVRPLCGPASSRRGTNKQRLKHRLPRGIYINYDDLVAMASGADADADDDTLPSLTLVNRGDAMLKAMDREIIALMRQVQQNKQQLSSLKRKSMEAGASVEEFRSSEPPAKINSRWTNDELLMAVTGVRKYGKDFAAIADTIGTKNEQHVRTFFASYRRRYNLDAVLREHEAEKGEGKLHLQLNGHASNSGEESGAEPGGGPSNGALAPDKMEVDSEGCPLGAPAERGGAPTTPKPKHNTHPHDAPSHPHPPPPPK